MTVGTKVRYNAMRSTYVGEIIGEGRDMLGDFWKVKVTSRSNPWYPLGTVDHISKGCAWLKERV